MDEEPVGSWAATFTGNLDPGTKGSLKEFIGLRVRNQEEDERRIGCIFCFESHVHLHRHRFGIRIRHLYHCHTLYRDIRA